MSRVLNWRPYPHEQWVGSLRLHQMYRLRAMLDSESPPDGSVAQFLPSIRNQGNQGSCTGHGSAAAIWISLVRDARSRGLADPPCPSPAWPYLLARAIEGTVEDDLGAYIPDVFAGIHQFGFVRDSDLAYDDTLILPPLERLEALKRLAYDQRLHGYSRIDSSGAQRIGEIKSAITAGYAITFGTLVDQAFVDWKPKDGYWPGAKRSLGGHCMCLVGYDPSGVVVANSWGDAWGDRGFVRCSWPAVDHFADLTIVATAPPYSGTEDA